MRSLTLCLAYYDNPTMLRRYLDTLEALPAAIKDQIAVNIVDDGSPRWAASIREIGLPVRLWRISIDVRWNQDAARNIAVRHSDTPWILLTDMDHIVPQSAFERALGRLNEWHVYRFSRMTLDKLEPFTLTPYKPHPNSWLMARSMFEKIGGYDERFAGYYGTDADFRDRVIKYAKQVEILKESIWRVPRTTIPDASTTTYERKAPADKHLGVLRAQRDATPNPMPLRFRFPYELVTECNP